MKERSKYLLRIALADQAFQEADAMASHILKSSPEDHLYYACVAGMVTCYCRPFMSSDGLGSISKDFSGSDCPEEYARMHSDMFVARDKLLAHFDLRYGEAEFHAQRYAAHPGEVQVYLGSERYEIQTRHTIFPLHCVGAAKRLIAFQQGKIQQQLTDFAIRILKETDGKFGSYVFVPKTRNT